LRPVGAKNLRQMRNGNCKLRQMENGKWQLENGKFHASQPKQPVFVEQP
jgi:hypothetical protein